MLIAGATGQLGRAVVAQLLRRDAKGSFAVLARDAAKAKPLADQGIEVRIADFDQPETLKGAFRGIARFLFVSTMSTDRAPQQLRVVDAAAAAGVKHIVYTGLAIKDIQTSGVRDLMLSHFQTEAHIQASGMQWTFLRNTMYAEAIRQIAGPNALNHGIVLSAGDGRVPYALRAEMGEATANLMLQEGHVGKTYDLTGAASISYAEIAEGLSRLVGRNLPYFDIPESALRVMLREAGMPEFPIWLTLGTLEDIRAGQYDLVSRDLESLLGRRPNSLDSMLESIFHEQFTAQPDGTEPRAPHSRNESP